MGFMPSYCLDLWVISDKTLLHKGLLICFYKKVYLHNKLGFPLE